jgi:hypothetical protein
VDAGRDRNQHRRRELNSIDEIPEGADRPFRDLLLSDVSIVMTPTAMSLGRSLLRDDTAQDLAEYGIALAVISASVAFIAFFIGFISLGLWEAAETPIGDALGGGS